MKPPTNKNRIAVVGRTGSGKTVYATWLLAQLRLDAWSDMPITIFDFKRAKLLARLGAKEININKKPPTNPGLYIVRPEPVSDDAAVLEYLRAVYKNTRHALFIDEAYELGPRNRGFRRLLTQGRELEIPLLYCMQRPVYCDKYSLSEADYFALFHLRIDDDAKTIRNLVPGYNREALEPFYSYWYDVASDQGQVQRPVPSEAQIVAMYRTKPTEYTAPEASKRVLL